MLRDRLRRNRPRSAVATAGAAGPRSRPLRSGWARLATVRVQHGRRGHRVQLGRGDAGIGHRVERPRVAIETGALPDPAGTTTPSRARQPASSSWVTPWCRGESREISFQMSSRLENPRSTPSRAASSLAIDPVRPGDLAGGDQLAQPGDPVLQVGEGAAPLRPGGGRQHHVRSPARSGQVGVDRDDEPGPDHGFHGQLGVGEVATGVGAEQHQAPDVAPAGGIQDRGSREPGLAREGYAPMVLVPGPAGFERDPARAGTPERGPCRAPRAHWLRRRADRKATPGRPASRRAAAATCSSDSASDGRPRITTIDGASGAVFSPALEM